MLDSYFKGNPSRGIDRGTYNAKSLVFDGSTKYLSRTWSASPTDNNACTVSFWVKGHAQDGTSDFIFGANSGTNEWSAVNFYNGYFILDTRDGSTTARSRDTEDSALLRDTHRWYHIVMQFDMDASGQADKWKVFVDGEEIATAARNSTLSQIHMNDASADHTIGARNSGTINSYFYGYLADFVWIDGDHTVSPSEFSRTSSDTDKYVIGNTFSSSYGDDGFHLDFNDDRASTPDTTSTIYDQSGNSNDWTGNSLTADSFSADVPVNNLDTFNPLSGSDASTYADGNRVATATTGNDDIIVTSVPIPLTGKWGGRFTLDSTGGSGNDVVGIIPVDAAFHGGSGIVSASHDQFVYASNGNTYQNSGAPTSSGFSTYTTNDYIEVFVDSDAGTINWAKGGGSKEGAISYTAGKQYLLVVGSASGSAGNTWTYDNEEALSDSDYKTLSSANLPVPTNLKPQDNGNIVLYTGDGSNDHAITGAGLQPDFSWIKERNSTSSNAVMDEIRGFDEVLYTDSSNAASATTNQVRSYDADGFTTDSSGTTNQNTLDYWSLLINAGNGSPVSNTDGSTTSSVLTDGINFSIVTYTGTGANATVGHGLASAPDFIIVKSRDRGSSPYTGNWATYHSSNTDAPETDYIWLNQSAATADATFWNDTKPTSSVFNLGTSAPVNYSGDDFVAYCFVFGDVFTGGLVNMNSSGTSFVPSDELLFAMIKRTGGTGDWKFFDQKRNPNNPAQNDLSANSSAVEATTSTYSLDFLSNGLSFKSWNSVTGDHVWFGIKKNGGQLAA